MNKLVPEGTVLKSKDNLNMIWFLLSNDSKGYTAKCLKSDLGMYPPGCTIGPAPTIYLSEVEENWDMIFLSKLVRLLWIG